MKDPGVAGGITYTICPGNAEQFPTKIGAWKASLVTRMLESPSLACRHHKTDLGQAAGNEWTGNNVTEANGEERVKWDFNQRRYKKMTPSVLNIMGIKRGTDVAV